MEQLEHLGHQALATIDKLGGLEQDHLFEVISSIYHFLHGSSPMHMEDWDNDDLIDWFTQTYQYNPVAKEWQCAVTIH